MAKKINDMTLEEKVDQILAYQKSARRWAVAGSIFKLFLFVIFVVIPIVLAVQFTQNFMENMKLDGVGGFLQNLDGPQDGIPEWMLNLRGNN